MIAYVDGTLTEASVLRAIVDVGGIGYEVSIPVTTAERLPANGSRVRLFTYAVYREDSQTLYGFATAEERDFFRLIVEKVQNVGPRTALGVMSALSLESLRNAILSGDVVLLSKAKGVGRKTAERLVLDLRDAVGPATGGPVSLPTASTGGSAEPAPQAAAGVFTDAVKALVALGFKPGEADQHIRAALAAIGPSATTEALVKRAITSRN
jgi:Holliday junction DNA helicase RuvA